MARTTLTPSTDHPPQKDKVEKVGAIRQGIENVAQNQATACKVEWNGVAT